MKIAQCVEHIENILKYSAHENVRLIEPYFSKILLALEGSPIAEELILAYQHKSYTGVSVPREILPRILKALGK